jgi:hypothetical protein
MDLQTIINTASECTGLKAIPSLLPLCADKDAVLLDVPSYSQTDDFSCGAIAAWSIVETFRPRASFRKFYDLVQPTPGEGVGPRRVLAALKRFRIGTRVRSKMGWKDIMQTIDDGFPMLVGTGHEMDDEGCLGDHWSLLFGYLARPKQVYLGNQPGLLRNHVVLKWRDFLKEWNPVGKAIVCWGL